MFYYAVLNGEKICNTIKSVNGEINSSNHILINSLNEDLIDRKYENGAWSAEKFPLVTPVPTVSLGEQVAQLQQDNLILMDALAMTFEEVMMLRMEMGGAV